MPVGKFMKAALAASVLLGSSVAEATPSTQIWIPSPDTQKFGTLHLNYDVYARPAKSTVMYLGPEVGVLPWKKVQAELGFDLIYQNNNQLDTYPLYFNGKAATPEDAWFKYSPSLAVGVYNMGIKPGLTAQNIGFALVGRTLPIIGRISAGYYYGNAAVLKDELGRAANQGVLLSWDRTMKEISDKLWFAVDFQSGQSMLGALNAGFAWAFTERFSLLLGYDHYLNRAVAGKDTATLQVDVNLF